MNKHLGNFTYIFFILLFFIITPIFIGAALGYRYNWTTKNIEKRGAFYIKSWPRGADIFIDNKRMRQKTPSQITDISSGSYTVTVAKENYAPWQKKLPVYSGETTFAEDIVLFLENRVKTNLGQGAQQILLNQKQDQYAYLDETNQLNITDIELVKNWLVAKLDKKYELLDWSADNQRLLLSLENRYYIFDINRKEITKLALSEVDKIIWDKNNGQALWYLKKQEIFRYQPDTTRQYQSEAVALSYPVNDFDLKDNWLITHHTQLEQSFINQINLNDFNVQQIINNVNIGKIKLFLANDKQLIFSVGGQMYIKTENNDTINIPFTNADIHDQRLLLTNGYEVILYNFKENWQALIDRSSQIVSDIIWHPNGSYFLSESNNIANLAEIDGRDTRNSLEIINDPHKKYYFFNRKGDQLFIITPQENFYLTIQ